MKTINIREFSTHPGLRHCTISDYSGEEFYHTILNSSFAKSYELDEAVLIDLDGTNGYPPSFLDEAIGNLVYDFGLNVVKKFVTYKSEEEQYLLDDIEKDTYPNWEKRRNTGQKPKKTEVHPDWYKIVDGELIKSQ